MDRRNFLKFSTATAMGSLLPQIGLGQESNNDEKKKTELHYHKIESLDFKNVYLNYPRLVGRNSRKNEHGNGTGLTLYILKTDKGAEGIGYAKKTRQEIENTFKLIKGKSVSDIFSLPAGILDPKYECFDIGLYDLAGVIFGQPVYEMLSGKKEPILTTCYSGMIYFDEMSPSQKPSGMKKILENCLYDYNYGYRKFKVKIGRGGKWMPQKEGIKADIEVTKMIYQNFPDCEILVDGNDAFTYDSFIEYLQGVENIPLYWIEEPFRETHDDYRKLKEWCLSNGRRNTLLADGEATPDTKLCLELGKEQYLDVYLRDVLRLGFSNWRKLLLTLRSFGMMGSPHCWGNVLNTFYCSHLAGAYGNIPTIEGVTCFSTDLDFSGYSLKGGRLIPSPAPGFGIRFIK